MRIKDARNSFHDLAAITQKSNFGPVGTAPSPSSVVGTEAGAASLPRLQRLIEGFIRANCVDLAAAKALRECIPEVQQIVLDRGFLGNAHNPSLALMMRIKDARNCVSGLSHQGPVGYSDSIENFIQTHGLDESAANTLRASPPDVQHAVLAKNFGGARNPSSALVKFINDVKSGSAVF